MIYAQETSTFRVVVAGGGVVGLTLANILERAGIDYILLESRPTLTPELGASIAIQANGARILDQLGCYDPLLRTTIPIEASSFVRPDGTYVTDHLLDVKLFETRHGYPLVFHDRQALLQTLYDNIDDKRKCRPNSKIVQAIQDDHGVTVQCDDGSIHRGSIVIGADGVRSKIRSEMWRAADIAQPGLIGEKEKNAMTAEYRCLYGICSKIPGITHPADYHCSLDKHRSMMTIVCSLERTYFFVFEKLDRVYQSHEIPRFTEADKQAFVERNSSLRFNQSVSFGDMYKHHIVSDLVCMEEAQYDHWTWGRFIMAGDSIHKATANQGSGGNQGIESATVIVNLLKRMLAECGPKPSKEQIQATLQEYPKIHQKRTNTILGAAGKLTRIHALNGLSDFITAYVTIPLAGDILLNMACENFVDSPYIEFLPLPARSLKGYMPYNPETGVDMAESRKKRFLFALPFVAIIYFTAQAMDLTTIGGVLDSLVQKPELTWGSDTVQTLGRITGFKPVDNLISALTIAFAPSILSWDFLSRIQNMHFMVDLGLMYAILLIEGARRCNLPTFAVVPNVFAMAAQRLSIGLVGPLYFLLHYTFLAPIDRFNSLDYRLTDTRYTNTVLLTTILFFYIPLAMSFGFNSYPSSSDTRMWWNAVWQVYPIFGGCFQYLLARYFLKKTVDTDKMYKPLRDLPAINLTLGALALVSTASWWKTILYSPFSVSELFVPGIAPSLGGASELMSQMRNFLQVDQLASSTAAILWLGLMHMDMYRAGMIETTSALLWIFVVGGFIAAVAGPGAAIACGFLSRERILATKKHKGAITAERLAAMDSTVKKQA